MEKVLEGNEDSREGGDAGETESKKRKVAVEVGEASVDAWGVSASTLGSKLQYVVS